MKKFLPMFYSLLIFSILACAEEGMIQQGIDSQEDPRIPDINIKQGITIINNGDTFNLAFTNGVAVNTVSELKNFTIENLGTSDLEIISFDLNGDNFTEFILEEPLSPFIPAGENTNFSIGFSPQNTDLKTATVTIQTNDPDESVYNFTINSISKPLPSFNARLRKGTLPLTVEFTSQSVGEIDQFEWDFNGDGIIDSTEENPICTYNESGVYSVALTTIGEGGVSYHVKSGYINVVLPPLNEIDSSFSGSVYAADINNDTFIDVIGAGQNEVAWWENDGTGNFTKHTVQNPYTNAEVVLAVDIDKDGHTDIVASKGENGEDIDWWQNAGNGSGWSAAQSIASGYYLPNTIFAADINNDTYPDIISMASENDGIYWFKNNGDATFDTTGILINSSYFGTPDSVVAADIDKDNIMDVLCTGNEDSGIAWWENTDDGTNWINHSIITDYNAESIYIGDLNGDTDIDLIGTAYYNGELVWWDNNGDKTFGSKKIIENDFSGAGFVYSDDFDGDGMTDIVSTAKFIDTIAWWKNVSDSSVEFQKFNITTEFLNPFTVFAADLNGDNKKDIIAGSTSENISWWNIHQNGIWDRHYVEPFLSQAMNVITADLNNDGLQDIIYNNSTDILFRLNTGNGHLSSAVDIIKDDSNIISIHAVDINGDTFTDIIANAGRNVSGWLNDGQGNFGTRQYLAYPPLPNDYCRVIHPHDLDNDGDIDIIAADILDATGDQIVWWENDGSGIFGTTKTVYSSITPYITHYAGAITISDLNNDSFNDIVIGDNSVVSQKITILFNNGDNTFNTLVDVDSSFNSTQQIFVSDIDSDNYPDIVAAAAGEYEIAWWNNNGDKTFSTRNTIQNNYNFAFAVYVADMNGDSHPDVIGAAAYADEISLFINKNGDGTVWTKELVANNFDYARSVCAADIDNDGDLDVLGAAMYGSEVSWWENNLKEYGP